MRIYCLCGHENCTLMPFDDPTRVRVSCTNACREARQLRAEMAVGPLSEKLSAEFPNVSLGLPLVGMLGH